MVSPPDLPCTPCSLVINDDLLDSRISQIDIYVSNTATLCAELEILFQNMRYLANTLGSWGHSSTMNNSMSFSKQRSTLEYRLLSMEI